MTDRKRRTPRAAEREQSAVIPAPLKAILKALLITALLGALLLLGASALLLRTKDPDRYHAAAGMAALYLTAFLGGFIAVRLNKRRAPVFCGLAEALLLLLLITLPLFFLPDEWRHTYTGAQTVGFRALLFPASVAGALLASLKRENRRKHR